MFVPYQKSFSIIKHAQYTMLKEKENTYKAEIAQLTQELSAKLGIIEIQERELNEKCVGVEQLTQELSTKQKIIDRQDRGASTRIAGNLHGCTMRIFFH